MEYLTRLLKLMRASIMIKSEVMDEVRRKALKLCAHDVLWVIGEGNEDGEDGEDGGEEAYRPRENNLDPKRVCGVVLNKIRVIKREMRSLEKNGMRDSMLHLTR